MEDSTRIPKANTSWLHSKLDWGIKNNVCPNEHNLKVRRRLSNFAH